ncbi:MAG: DNA-binding domain-containing protein, partial [Gammaproteobacteria bacterium]
AESAPAPQDAAGIRFIAWLRKSIQSRTLMINEAKALVHTVSGTAYLVSPGIFMRYIQEHPELARVARDEKLPDWQWAQKAFERLRLHRKQEGGLNIWTCDVTGPRRSRRLHGYLLTDGLSVFAEMPFDNPYLKLLIKNGLAESHAA